MTSEATALQIALPLFNTKITSHRCKHCGGSGYKKSRYDGINDGRAVASQAEENNCPEGC